jgi:amino acid adenylation domain-containing protein
MFETAEINHVLVPSDQHPQPVLLNFVDIVVLGVLSDGSLESYGDAPVVASPNLVPEVVADDATAYVLFTSGSTGRPKGCMVGHRGSANYAQAVVQSCGLTEDMVFLMKTPYVFDVSVQDIFTAFAAGGTLVIATPGAEKDAGAICDIIIGSGVNCVCFVPTLLVEFSNYLSSHQDDAARVRETLMRVLTIGEALMSATCKQMFQYFPALEINNLYGPTEASVGVSHEKVTAATLGQEVVVPIGRPYGYTTFKVFNASKYEGTVIKEDLLEEVKCGEAGELFIGGDCLAKGYINNPEKTNAAFFCFPEVVGIPEGAASPFSLYKTGDLVRQREDGVFEYLGRTDFQVKIGGVRIECEEVSSVLQEHPAVDDALVTAFDGPFGKALAAYVVVASGAKPSDLTQFVAEEVEKVEEEDSIENVSKWGAVYDEMYMEQDNSISEQDPTLNWSGYIDTYSGKSHTEPVIKEWVEWSCEQVTSQREIFEANRASGRKSCVLEIGCGNGMLLFRLASLTGDATQGRYIGTDISTTALQYIELMRKRPEYEQLNINVAKFGAHEVDQVCAPRECDIVLCNGVTMYFPSAAYLIDSMRMSADVTKPGGRVFYGDIQSRKHILCFRAHVETYHALPRPEATAAAVLHAVYEMAAREELSYFDDELFQRLDSIGDSNAFGGRVKRIELRLKRGWWGSEFSRFRYDIELVMKDGLQDEKDSVVLPAVTHVSYNDLCEVLGLSAKPTTRDLVDSKLVSLLPGWTSGHLSGVHSSVDVVVVTLPNARTFQAAQLLEWLKVAAQEGKALSELPSHLHPRDVGAGSPEESARFGIEPEMLFSMTLPAGWTKRVIWAEDPGMLRFVLLRTEVAERPWLGAVCAAPATPLPDDISIFKNQATDFEDATADPEKLWNEHFKLWASTSRLLPAMRPAVYVTLERFPKNAAGKIDRGQLPDASAALEKVSDVATFSYEPATTDQERQMVKIWEKVLHNRQVGVNTPFVAYGGHSLTAVQLCSAVVAEFGKRPDLLFLTSADCTVRELLKKFERSGLEKGARSDDQDGCVCRLSPSDVVGIPLLIFCSAGTGVASYQAVAKQATRLQVYAVELPGRGRRAHEAAISRFDPLFDSILPDISRWAEKHHRFYLWGDSLGAVLAYEFACRLEQSSNSHVMGLFVSGNAGPTVASTELGIGETVQLPRGPCNSACEMDEEDWKQFLLISSGEGPSGELARILKDPALAPGVIGPVRADCLAYESYHLSKTVRLSMPIITICGANDHIASPQVLKTWKEVAKGRIEHTIIPRSGHRIAQERPGEVANTLHLHSLPNFVDELHTFRSYRAAYRLLRRQDQAGAASKLKQGTMFKFSTVMSPFLGASKVPSDLNIEDLNLDALKPSAAITPQTKQVLIMRQGNAEWRIGNSAGNPLNMA